MRITICGLAASGKSTIARLLAIRYRLVYVGLGSIFRAVGMLALREKRGLSAISENEMRRRIAYRWDVHEAKIKIDGGDIMESLQNPAVAEITARMLAQSENWSTLIRFCNSIMESYENVVCEGRNAGIEFLPYADIKCALVAELPVRIARRHAELQAKGKSLSYGEIERQIKERDEMDTRRRYAPFRIPHGATVMDTSHRSIEECISVLSDNTVWTHGEV